MSDERTPVEAACAAVAQAAFGHVSEFQRRAKFEDALAGLIGAIASEYESAIDSFEARIAGLEKDTHPPVALRPIVIQEVTDAMKRRQLRGKGC